MHDPKQQIVQAHAAFICDVVTSMQEPKPRHRFDALMKSASDNGWQALVAVLNSISEGRRDVMVLNGLDQEDSAIAEAILQGLQDPSSLPDPNKKADATMAAPGLAGMIHAAATGNVQALTLISQMAEQMQRAGGDMARIAAVIRPLINGERDLKTLSRKMDERGKDLLEKILEELELLSKPQ